MHILVALKALYVLVITIATTSGHTCKSNADCNYGKCDTGLQRCVCNLACNLFKTRKLVCAHLKQPMTECEALNLACELQNDIPLKTFNYTQFLAHKSNCKRIKAATGEKFCVDQTYCNNNGICLQRPELELPYCRCMTKYTGDRCEIKKPVLLETHQLQSRSFIHRLFGERTVGFPSSNNHNRHDDEGIASLSRTVMPIISLGMVTCFMAACFIYFIRRRKSNNARDSDNQENIEQVHEETDLERKNDQEMTVTINSNKCDLSQKNKVEKENCSQRSTSIDSTANSCQSVSSRTEFVHTVE